MHTYIYIAMCYNAVCVNSEIDVTGLIWSYVHDIYLKHSTSVKYLVMYMRSAICICICTCIFSHTGEIDGTIVMQLRT